MTEGDRDTLRDHPESYKDNYFKDTCCMGIMKSAGVCGVKCFIIQDVAKIFLSPSGCGEFQIMCTEQHGLL